MSETARKSVAAAEPKKTAAEPATESSSSGVQVSAHRYEDRTLEELQGLAEDRGLAKSGTKAELAARLRGESAPEQGSERDERIARLECVVDDGTVHVGRAVNGVVCSAHAMHYLADGTPRAR